MERIKIAIEKAKAGEKDFTNLNVRPLSPNLSRNEAAVSTAATALTDVGVPFKGPVSVAYEQTAIVVTDPVHLERHRVIAHQKTHPASWAFDVLRTQILQKMDENGWRTLAITSPSVESGKTVVAINLAMSIAQQTHRTALLVDFDLRRPSLARSLGLNQVLSLNDVLTGDIEVGEALVNPGIERFVVLPTNQPVAAAAEMLSSTRVSALVNELRERYSDRIVIFDLPPVLVADDVMAILPRIDCVLMVVGNGASTESELEEAMARISRANVLGVVLNKDESAVPKAYY